MLVVTGTKRSGTSMWMQILQAAGFEVIGEPFPRNWESTIKAANPHGFYESKLCAGIYHATNPEPTTGEYLFPDQVRHHAVKVFIPGVIRTELAFLDRCVASIRPWSEYVVSLRKLQALSSDAEDLDDSRGKALELAPELEWWAEYFTLIRDVASRRYPIHFQAYRTLLAEPEKTLTEVFAWIGDGDVDAGCAAIDQSLYRSRSPDTVSPTTDLPPGCTATFDALYETISTGAQLSTSLIDRFNATHKQLEPFYLQHQANVTDHLARSIATKAEP